MSRLAEHVLIVVLTLVPPCAQAQSPPNIAALTGLAPVAALPNSPEGKAALDANLKITGDIQSGALAQPLLMSFPEQQKFALRDSFITDGNATQLADGLGSKLGAAYQERAQYKDFQTFTSVAQSVADFIGYTNNIAKSDSNAGKYFFANATTNGKTPVSEAAAAILSAHGGVIDVFGKTYGRPAGSQGADAYGNSRPFQTEPRLIAFRSEDYFGRPSHSLDWLRGPNQNLFDSPSYPSGHTTYGYTEAVVLAILVPERYQQMIARAAEYGNDRIVVGAHYAMDVLGGRATALHAVAHLLANDPAYVGQTRKNPAVLNEMSHGSGKDIVITDYTRSPEGGAGRSPRVSEWRLRRHHRDLRRSRQRPLQGPCSQRGPLQRDPDLRSAGRAPEHRRPEGGCRHPRAGGRPSPDRGLPRDHTCRSERDPDRDPGTRRRLPGQRLKLWCVRAPQPLRSRGARRDTGRHTGED